jgi:hypothetical protein
MTGGFSKSRMKIFRNILFVFGLLLMVYPYESSVVPAVRIQVLDVEGKPASNVLIKQEWLHFSIESNKNIQYSRTDDWGYVSFPERTARAPFIWRLFSTLSNLLTQGGLHASFGGYSRVTAYGDNPSVWIFVEYVPGRPFPNHIKLQSWSVNAYP